MSLRTMGKTPNERELARLLWDARKNSQVDRIKSMASDLYGTRWRPLGDRPNNIGMVTMGSEPGLAIVERITNMFDAMLELAYERNPQTNIESPRTAAIRYYGVPTGGLADLSDSDRRELAKNMIVSLEDSGNADCPTVIVQDKGSGQTPSSVPRTLLSLGGENKVDKPWTMGTYGQGGSVTYGFCESTIVISRAHPALLNGEADRVGWTVVEKRFDSTKRKMPNYEYLVAADGNLFELDPEYFPQLQHGSRFTHIEYDLQIRGPFTTNPFQYFNAALFDPVLPFLLAGYRKKDKSPGDRVIIGSGSRLRNVQRARGKIEIAHDDIVSISLPKDWGNVLVSYWVLARPEGVESKSDPAASYVSASNAIAMTLHGQRQDSESRQWIKTNLQLPFLYKNMIIQIDATGLSPEAKAILFASTRERGRQSDIRTRIYSDLADNLRNDEYLKQLNHEAKEKLLQQSTAAASEKVRKRLRQFIKTKMSELSKGGSQTNKDGSGSDGSGSASRVNKRGSRGSQRDTTDDHLPTIPTYLRFSRKHLRVHRGERAHVNLLLNAKNKYLPKNDAFLDIKIQGPHPSKVRVSSRSSVMGGQARWVLEASEDAPLGSYKLRAELTTTTGLLSDEITVETLEKRQATGQRKGGKEPETGPNVHWVYKDAWDEHEMTADSVGRVTEDAESTDIWVNRHYRELDKAFRGRNLTPEQIQTRSDRYQYPVACGLWLQEFSLKNLKDGDPRPTEKYLELEMQRLADAVLVAIDPDVDVAAEQETSGLVD